MVDCDPPSNNSTQIQIRAVNPLPQGQTGKNHERNERLDYRVYARTSTIMIGIDLL